MTDFEDKKRKLALKDEEERGTSTDTGTGEGGESGSSGGQGGAIEFHDFVFIRTDQYSADEERQILAIHKDASGALIDKQKQLRDQRENRKENPNQKMQQGFGMEDRDDGFLRHPILSEKAEFDGADPQVNFDPVKNEAETNNDKKQELTYQHQLRLGLQNQPKFVPPKPSPF